jgi:hypothetical protein
MKVKRKISNPKMRKEKGVCVYDSGRALAMALVRKTSREIREERQRQWLGQPLTRVMSSYNFAWRNRSEFVITDTELKLMAAAARIGLSKIPKNGYKIPPAMGTPTEL